MDVQVGDRVSVNLAPFIASVRRCMDSVPCKVVEVARTQVRIVTSAPTASWICGSRPIGSTEG